MQIISWNVNGLRSVCRHGFREWLDQAQPDLVCLQEIKTNPTIPLSQLFPHYHCFINPATKPGYSGVMVLSKLQPSKVVSQLGLERFDSEGRFLHLDFPTFSLINIYFPHGGRQKQNLDYKLTVYQHFLDYLSHLRHPLIVGDFNIAHQAIDLARPKPNRHNIMFTPPERAQLDALISQNFVDTFRYFHPTLASYTWWPYLKSARTNNIGWRIDYCFSHLSLLSHISASFISTSTPGSDHCPIGVNLDL